jgi:hypothetical protein
MLDGGPVSSGPGEPNSSPAGRTAGMPEEPDAPVAAWLHIPTLNDISPLDYALAVMRDHRSDPERRDKMCIALLPYLHTRAADAKPNKKDQKNAAAEVAASRSRFATATPPALKAVK